MNSPRAKKSFGQNFLVDERVIDRIIRAADARGGETIIEIGAGRGALTKHLVEKDCKLVAIEFDRELIESLREEMSALANFVLIESDALTMDFCAAIQPALKARVVANLPYNISTAILQRLIEQRRCITEMILMLQREVVERIMAPPGSSERGYLSVLVEAYCEVEKLFDVAPTAFRPVPKVWSTVARLNMRTDAPLEIKDETLLWRAVSVGFAQRRKTIFNNLRQAPPDVALRIEAKGGSSRVLEAARIEPQRRAETLALEEWLRLARVIEEKLSHKTEVGRIEAPDGRKD